MIKPCKIYWYLGVLVLFLVAGCASSPQHLASNSPPTDILAKVGNRVITLSEFKDRLDNLPERYRQRLNNKEAKEKFLKKVVNLSLFSIDARAQGINKEKAVRPRLQDAADAVLAREYIKREITDRITVSDEDVNDYYNRHLSRFKQPEKVKARHILVRVAQNAGPEDLAEAQNKARDLKAQLDKGADFTSLAKKNSNDPASRQRGGSLGYFTRGEISKKISPEFSKAAFSLRIGEISEPVKTRHGYHIIKVEVKRPEQITALEKVRKEIEFKLRKDKENEALQEITERLKAKYGVVLNLNLLIRAEKGPDMKRRKK